MGFPHVFIGPVWSPIIRIVVGPSELSHRHSLLLFKSRVECFLIHCTLYYQQTPSKVTIEQIQDSQGSLKLRRFTAVVLVGPDRRPLVPDILTVDMADDPSLIPRSEPGDECRWRIVQQLLRLADRVKLIPLRPLLSPPGNTGQALSVFLSAIVVGHCVLKAVDLDKAGVGSAGGARNIKFVGWLARLCVGVESAGDQAVAGEYGGQLWIAGEDVPDEAGALAFTPGIYSVSVEAVRLCELFYDGACKLDVVRLDGRIDRPVSLPSS